MMFQSLTQARKHLTNKGLREVHLRAVAKVKELKGREFELIELLHEVDDKKVYRFAGFSSLFNYCVQALELSEHQACEYIAVARKAKQFPELKRALKDQEISVTKARRVAAVITRENQEQWLKIAKTSSKRELEKAIAGHSPRAVYHETSRYVSSSLLQVQVIVDEETLALIKRAQDLLSQSTPISMGQAAKEVFSEFVERHCPVKKAERAQKKRQAQAKASDRGADSETNNSQSGPGQIEDQNTKSASKDIRPNQTKDLRIKQDTKAREDGKDKGKDKDKLRTKATEQRPARRSSQRVYSRALLHQVMLRDRAQCTHQDLKGQRCPERRWLEVHHLKPISRGGTNDLNNLRLLCRGHHQLVHSVPLRR